jgi:hypothetical protein
MNKTLKRIFPAEPGADGHHAPVLHIAHEGYFAEPLHDGIVVHQHGDVMPPNRRDRVAEKALGFDAFNRTAVRPMASSPTRLAGSPPPTTMRCVPRHFLRRTIQRITVANS